MKQLCSILIFLIISSGYCASKQPDITSLTILDMRYLLAADLRDPQQVRQVWDQLHTVATLQGIVNRESPHLYIKYIVESGHSIDEYWWNKYRQAGEWLAGRDTTELRDIPGAVQMYKEKINGVVVYDPNVASTSNVASAVAGIESLIAVRYDPTAGSLYSQIVTGGPKLPVRMWLINKDGSSLFTGKGEIPDTDLPSTGSVKKHQPGIYR